MQKFINSSEIKLVPASETILLGIPYTEKVILHVLLGYLH